MITVFLFKGFDSTADDDRQPPPWVPMAALPRKGESIDIDGFKWYAGNVTWAWKPLRGVYCPTLTVT